MKRLALAGLCLACAGAVFGAGKAEVAVSVTLEPRKVHEECQRVEAGQKRRYHWKSNAPVDFNVHYHDGPEVFYPVKRDRMRGDGGTFAAKTAQEYCWMWTAREAPATITGTIETH
jgi:hypothetical protein